MRARIVLFDPERQQRSPAGYGAEGCPAAAAVTPRAVALRRSTAHGAQFPIGWLCASHTGPAARGLPAHGLTSAPCLSPRAAGAATCVFCKGTYWRRQFRVDTLMHPVGGGCFPAPVLPWAPRGARPRPQHRPRPSHLSLLSPRSRLQARPAVALLLPVRQSDAPPPPWAPPPPPWALPPLPPPAPFWPAVPLAPQPASASASSAFLCRPGEAAVAGAAPHPAAQLALTRPPLPLRRRQR